MNTIFLYSMPISNGKEQLWPLALAIIGSGYTVERPANLLYTVHNYCTVLVTGKREGGGGDGTGTLEKDLLQNTLYKTIGTTGKREQRGGGLLRLQDTHLHERLKPIT